jgi:hypothetical protein
MGSSCRGPRRVRRTIAAATEIPARAVCVPRCRALFGCAVIQPVSSTQIGWPVPAVRSGGAGDDPDAVGPVSRGPVTDGRAASLGRGRFEHRRGDRGRSGRVRAGGP